MILKYQQTNILQRSQRNGFVRGIWLHYFIHCLLLIPNWEIYILSLLTNLKPGLGKIGSIDLFYIQKHLIKLHEIKYFNIQDAERGNPSHRIEYFNHKDPRSVFEYVQTPSSILNYTFINPIWTGAPLPGVSQHSLQYNRSIRRLIPHWWNKYLRCV